MSEEPVRPERPQYGEYATPEEQANALGASHDASESARRALAKRGAFGNLHEGEAPRVADPATAPRAPLPRPLIESPRAAGAGRPRDALLTSFLLGLGILSVINSFSVNADLFGVINTAYAQLGYGKYTSMGLAAAIGVALDVSQALIFAVTFWFALRAVRRGKRSFTIPLIGAAAYAVIAIVLFTIAMTGDPALLAHLNSVG